MPCRTPSSWLMCRRRPSWAGVGRKEAQSPDYRSRTRRALRLPCRWLGGRLGPARPGPQAGARALAPCLHSRVSEEGGRDGGCAGAAGTAQATGRLDEVARQGWRGSGRPLGWEWWLC